ncbi:MAG TPA: hypothetical protein VI112_05730 [Bacteroidia bacterium]|jgi:hypothetical protein
MKKIISFSLFLFASALPLLWSACRHQPVVPDQPAISFSGDILPIVGGNCMSSNCHGGEAFDLSTYDEFTKQGRITPYKPYNSKVYTSITATSGEDMMPPSPQKPLTDQQINTIYLWILQGALNN